MAYAVHPNGWTYALNVVIRAPFRRACAVYGVPVSAALRAVPRKKLGRVRFSFRAREGARRTRCVGKTRAGSSGNFGWVRCREADGVRYRFDWTDH